MRSDVVPPAPHVKSMKSGSCLAMISICLCSFSTPSGVFGGKYSNEMNGLSVAAVHSFTMSQILPCLTFGRAPRESTAPREKLRDLVLSRHFCDRRVRGAAT